MGWLVPYVINGASHSAELFRRQAQRPMSEDSGVARIDDLKVVPLTSAGAGFRVMPGAGSVRSRYANRDRESYGVELDSALDVTGIAGTGSTARRDAVVVVVRDPNYDTSVSAADAAAMNYMDVVVVQGVASAAKSIDDISALDGVTGYVVGFINWPASQTAVQASYIEDARTLAAPREKTVVRAFGVHGSTSESLSSSSAYPAGETWPDAATAEAKLKIDIPDWAVQASIVLTVSGVKVPGGGQATGLMWVQVAQNVNSDNFKTEATRWDVDELSGQHRVTLVTADTKTIPAGLRGTAQNFYPRGNLTAGAVAKSLVADNGTTVTLTVVFREIPE